VLKEANMGIWCDCFDFIVVGFAENMEHLVRGLHELNVW
jgi:hypothetical protein